MTPNILGKVEWVNQKYLDFPSTDIRNGGQFKGFIPGLRGNAESGGETSSKSLIEGEVTEGLDTASEYLALLGRAFPDVAAGTGYRALATDLGTARDQVEQARDGAVVSTSSTDGEVSTSGADGVKEGVAGYRAGACPSSLASG